MAERYSIEELNFDLPEHEDLISSLTNGTCIFIGAGISKLAGYRLWEELARDMVEEFWSRKQKIADPDGKLNFSAKTYLLTEANPIEVMDYLFFLDQDIFYSILENSFQIADEKVGIYSKFNSLVQIRDNFFVQTNIDLGFQNSLNISGDNISINPMFNNPPKKLNYLHGRLKDRESLIFTRRHYDDNYLKDSSKVMQFLIPIFQTRSVVFFGYSLRDFEILQAISKARMGKEEKEIKTHYLFEPVYGYKLTEFKVRSHNVKNNFGIKMIPYNIENEGYELISKVLDKVSASVSRKMSIDKKEAVTAPNSEGETQYEK